MLHFSSVICFSHLGWDFVYQRPQHLLSRFAVKTPVYYFEEARHSDHDHYEIHPDGNVTIIRLFAHPGEDMDQRLEKLVQKVIAELDIHDYLIWYYTPMALSYTEHLNPKAIVFDSMDELSAFRFAPPRLLELEEKLFEKADIVFTGGQSLFEAKKHRHHNIHAFPSSIDKEHFLQARNPGTEPEDQQSIPRPRLGFYGVVDERFDTHLLAEIAQIQPDWQFIIIGPVVKISDDELPKAANIHYLGQKSYQELPAYIRHWDIAMNMFALNESTRYISPTKTPEYLSAGLPVISTPIQDVIRPYGEKKLVTIISSAEEFITAAQEILTKKDRSEDIQRADDFLSDQSWDHTYSRMLELIQHLKKD